MLMLSEGGPGPRFIKRKIYRGVEMKEMKDVTNKYTILQRWQLHDEKFFDDLQAARNHAIDEIDSERVEPLIVAQLIEQVQPIKPAYEVEVTNVEVRKTSQPG
jgi:hypothetical protein